MTLLNGIVILLLIGVTSFYVAAEFAAVGSRRSRIRQLAEEGRPLAARILPVLEDRRLLVNYLAASQIGITLSSLILGAYGQATLAGHLVPLFVAWGAMDKVAAHSVAIMVVLLALTFLQMLLGELIPKSVALQYPAQMAMLTILPMTWSMKLFSWFVGILNGSSLVVLKLLGMQQVGQRHIHSPEEIDLLIAESRDGGLLESDEHRRLHRALLLGMRRVHKLMVPRRLIAAIDIDAPLGETLRKVAESPYTRLPIYRGSIDNIIGMLHAKDLVMHYLERGGKITVAEVMRPILSIPETVTAEHLLELLRRHHCHQAVLVDEFGGVAGLITLEDVLAEVLGDVADEFKTGMPLPERLPDGRVRLPGLMHLDDAESSIGTPWKGDATTVGGLVMEALGHVPVPGEATTIEGVEMEVERVDNQAVISVLARPVDRSLDRLVDRSVEEEA